MEKDRFGVDPIILLLGDPAPKLSQTRSKPFQRFHRSSVSCHLEQALCSSATGGQHVGILAPVRRSCGL